MPVSVPIYVWQGAGGGRRDIHSTGSGVWAIFANSITSHNPSITDGMGVGWLCGSDVRTHDLSHEQVG